MATFLGSAALAGSPAKGATQSGQEVVVYGSYELEAALALNDVIEMIKVPENATVLGVTLITDDVDTATGIVLDVGDGDDTDRYIDGSTLGQTGGISDPSDMQVAGIGHTYTTPDTIDVLVQVAPGTGTTSGTVALIARYITP